MRRLRAIDRKVLRDLGRMRGQLVAIALVIACGVGVYVGMRATMRSLERARSDHYAELRFGDVFASLERAPEGLARRVAALPGVQAVQTRVVAGVVLDVPGMVEAATGQLVSIPDQGPPSVNDLRLVAGRLPAPGRTQEVVAGEAFMEAHGLRPGAGVSALIDGTHVDLRIVGVGLSPEFTYSVAPGLLFPDDRRFGVFWMRREALAAAYDLDGAFNDLSLRLGRDANPREVIRRVDQLLEPYGGLGAIPRADQQSAFFLESDLAQLEAFSFFVPGLFLAVAAFLLNIVLGRLIAGQRGDIAALKALGYRDREVGAHYGKLLAVIVLSGWALGIGLGAGMGSGMTHLYGRYYRLPDLRFAVDLREPLEGLLIGFLGAGSGALAALRRTVTLPPAEAMRPESPPVYRATLPERLGLTRWLPTGTRSVLRELERRPLRSLMSITGVALAAALMVVMSFSLDSIRHVLNVQFGLAQREDMALTLTRPRSTGVLGELRALPGVLHAEPFRAVPVELSLGHRRHRGSVTGLPPGAALVGLLDRDLRDVPLPPAGLVLSRKLAELLGARAGDTLRLEVLEGTRARREVRVARVVETFMGAGSYMELGALCRLLGEPPGLNGAHLLVDPARMDDLHREVKALPLVAGVTERDHVLRSVDDMLDENLGTMTAISLGFALVMAMGVLYNTARITLTERARELATLRVLGFRRGEVASILVGELLLVVVVALPLGLLLGRGLADALVHSPGFDTEQFRLPLVVRPATYATAALAVVVAAVQSGWGAWRRLDRIDIVEVLKTRE